MSADPVTLALLTIGALCAALWYATHNAHREREAKRLVGSLIELPSSEEVKKMPRHPDPSSNLPAVLVRSLPPQVDEHWVENRVLENLKVFRDAPGLLDKFFVTLRDRYSSKWELEILERVKTRLQVEVEVMEIGAHHAAVRRTLVERTDTEMLTVRTQHERARQDHAEATDGASHREKVAGLKRENELLEEQVKNEELRRKLNKAPTSSKSPPTAEERFAERMRRTDEAVAKMEALTRRMNEALERVKKEHGEDSEIFKKTRNMFETEIEQLMKERKG